MIQEIELLAVTLNKNAFIAAVSQTLDNFSTDLVSYPTFTGKTYDESITYLKSISFNSPNAHAETVRFWAFFVERLKGNGNFKRPTPAQNDIVRRMTNIVEGTVGVYLNDGQAGPSMAQSGQAPALAPSSPEAGAMLIDGRVLAQILQQMQALNLEVRQIKQQQAAAADQAAAGVQPAASAALSLDVGDELVQRAAQRTLQQLTVQARVTDQASAADGKLQLKMSEFCLGEINASVERSMSRYQAGAAPMAPLLDEFSSV